MTFLKILKFVKGLFFAISEQIKFLNTDVCFLCMEKIKMQDQNVLALENEDQDSINLFMSAQSMHRQPSVKADKKSKTFEKNLKIFSENDTKKLGNLLFQYKQKMNQKTMTPKQLLTQHKEILLDLFSLGATVEEVLLFLEKNNFIGLTARNLSDFSKSLK